MKIYLICSLLTPASGWILIPPPRDVLEPRKRRRRRDETLTRVYFLSLSLIIITSIVIVIVITIAIVIVIIIIIMQEIIVEKYPRGYFSIRA